MGKPNRVGAPICVWKSPYKSVWRHDFKFPDGVTRDFYLLGKEGIVVSLVFPLTDAEKVLVVRQWRPGANGYVYEFPGGNPKGEQSPEETALEELLEETGYEPDKLVPLSRFWVDPPALSATIAPFLALNCRKVREPNPDASELIQPIEFPLLEWLQMCFRQESLDIDAKTLAITLLVLPFILPSDITFYLRGKEERK